MRESNKHNESLNNDKSTAVDTFANEEKYINPLFLGSYAHGIDGKGRIIIPANYRGGLGDVFVICPTRNMDAIALYPQESWREVALFLEKIRTSPSGSKLNMQNYLNQFAKYVFLNMESDAQGRVLIPAKMRKRFLGDSRDLEISGAFDHIRIVTSEDADKADATFDENRMATMDDIAELLSNI